MSPLPATLPMATKSQSPPQTLVSSETTVTSTSNSSEMTTSDPMTVQSGNNSTSVSSVCVSGNNNDTNNNSNNNNTTQDSKNDDNINNNKDNLTNNNTKMKSESNSNTLITSKMNKCEKLSVSVTSSENSAASSSTTDSLNSDENAKLESEKSSGVIDNLCNTKSNVMCSVETSDINCNNNNKNNDKNVDVIDKVNKNNGNTNNNKNSNNYDNSNINKNTNNENNDNDSKNVILNKNNNNNSGKINSENCDDNFKPNKSDNKENISNDDKETDSSSVKDEKNNNTEDFIEKPRRILLKNVNPHIICNLCKGYLIDATTIVECLHSFCHSCIMKHLRTEQYCPRCEMMINTAKPNIKPDTTLQAIVYKLVPGLYEKELMRKRAFYRDRPEEAKLATPEQRGEDTEYLIFGPTENMSLSLEYADIEELPEFHELKRPKYLLCPAILTVAHLKKFILLKFGINPNLFSVEIMYKVKTIVLSSHYTLMDVAYIYTWKRDAEMRFFFRIKQVDDFKEKLKACRRSIKTKEISIENKLSQKSLSKENRNNHSFSKHSNNLNRNETPRIKSETVEDKAIVSYNDVEVTEVEKLSHKTSNENNNSVGKGQLITNFKTENETEDVEKIKKIKTEVEIKQEPLEISVENNINRNVDSILNSTRTELSNEKLSINSGHENNEQLVEGTNKSEKSKVTFATKNKTKAAVSADETKLDSTSKSAHKYNKISKQQQHTFQKSSEQEERKVENIKLKIDLSKQSSVTIINMSGPENTRKEVVKPVKQDKEWKLKMKKDKESSLKSSPKGEDRYKIKANEDLKNSLEDKKLLVPPITIKAERISPNSKEGAIQLKVKQEEPKSPQNVELLVSDKEDEEEKKSRFLNSFALTPIKSTNSPDKTGDKKFPANEISAISQVPLWMGLNTANSNKTTTVSKRKSKEPIKTPAKKARIESAKITSNETKPVVKLNEKSPPKESQTISFKLAPFPIDSSFSSELSKKQEDEKLMPAPPPLKMIEVLKKNGIKQSKQTRTSKWTATNKAKITSQSSQMPAPPGSLTPRPMIPSGIASSKLPITPSPPGNRTPIARRYPPILPKSPRPNPFANLPTDVNKLLQNNGTEIKQISSGNNQELKVYGPAMSGKNTQKSPNSAMSAPNMSPARGSIKNQNTNYLNYALMNASKTKVDVMPLGCRTPIYTPSSPIYSPNSPQYMPNYNIPTQPTYKYTKTQSSASNYLQNVLGQNKQLSSLFPAPPIKKPPESLLGNSSKTSPPQLSVTAERSNDENSIKRSYPFSRSPPSTSEKAFEPPEKQAKVQSLLNSCNINIPSSLSITITNEDNESGTISGSSLKHKSPVNNYIEILKLPESQPVISSEQQSVSEQKLKTTTNQFETKIDVSGTCSSSQATINSIKTVTMNNTPRSSPMQITGTNSIKNAPSPSSVKSNSNTNLEKKVEIAKSPSPNSKEKKPSPERKTGEKNQKKSGNVLQDKKKSPETVAGKSNKTNECTSTLASLKKFRHILPRVTTASQNIATTTLSVSTPTKTSPIQKNSFKQSQQKPSPTGGKRQSPNPIKVTTDGNDKKPEILDLTGNSPKTPPPSITLPVTASSIPSSVPATVASLSQMPPGASDIAAFLNETILRAQHSANGNGIFLPHLAAAASFNPSFASINFGYNIQQAYLMEQFSRMQKAGHEALEKYMQKLKAGAVNTLGSIKSGPNSPNDSSNNVSIAATTVVNTTSISPNKANESK